MKTLKQLLRQPVKTAVGILMVALAFAVLVTCVGQYTATDLTRKNLDDRYTTTALYNDDYFWEKTETGGVRFLSVLPEETQAWVDEITQTRADIVKTISQTGLLSAYSSGLRIDNFSNYAFGKWIDQGFPYCCAMLEITLTDIGTVYYENMSTSIDSNGEKRECLDETRVFCVGTVDRIVGLEQGFSSPLGQNILLEVAVYSVEDFEALELCIGEKYLIYGMNFSNDVKARLSAMHRDAYEELFGALQYRDPLSLFLDYSPILERIGCVMEICDFSSIPSHQPAFDENDNFIGFEPVFDRRIRFDETGMGQWVPTEEYIADYQLPTFAHLTGSADEFLASEEGTLWRKWLENLEINNHSFPVLCVEKLGYQAGFFREDARIVDGRDFTENELANGEKVCIIAQSQATRNGLQVGDTITLRPYGFDYNVYPNQSGHVLTQDGFPSAFIYCDTVGFTAELEQYTIVGLYRQNNAWEDYLDPYGFTPNTIFIPKSSVTAPMMTFTSGPFSTLVLENGKREEFKTLMAEAGYPDLFICYDQGYSEIMATLDAYEEVSKKALYIGLAGFSAVVLLFLVLYPNQQKRALRLMGTLGAPSWARLGHTFGGTLCILVPGALLGGFVGERLWQRIAAALMEWVNVEITLEADMSAVAPKLTAVGLAGTALLALLVSATLSRTKGLLKRK